MRSELDPFTAGRGARSAALTLDQLLTDFRGGAPLPQRRKRFGAQNTPPLLRRPLLGRRDDDGRPWVHRARC